MRLPENPNAHFQVAFAAMKERKNRQTEPSIRLARKSPKGTVFGACKAFCFSGRENKCWEMQICACVQAQRILYLSHQVPLCARKSGCSFHSDTARIFLPKEELFFVATAPLGRKQACHGWTGRNAAFFR
jgi:hypothetical protein